MLFLKLTVPALAPKRRRETGLFLSTSAMADLPSSSGWGGGGAQLPAQIHCPPPLRALCLGSPPPMNKAPGGREGRQASNAWSAQLFWDSHPGHCRGESGICHYQRQRVQSSFFPLLGRFQLFLNTPSSCGMQETQFVVCGELEMSISGLIGDQEIKRKKGEGESTATRKNGCVIYFLPAASLL